MLQAATQQTQPLYYIKDDCDRASDIVGYDINNYVFGNLNTPKQTTKNPSDIQTRTPAKKSNPLLGLLALGLLGAGSFFALKKGGKVKLPDISKIPKKININV